MRNIRITLSYEGTGYGGFQRQENNLTVQEIVETAIYRLTQEKSTLYFVARTDAGVHAYGQECTFFTHSSIPGDKFLFPLNELLPGDIRVRRSREVALDFSVRKRNYGKTYGYLFTESRTISPFLKRYAWNTGRILDMDKMKKAALHLEGRHDFTSFRGNNSVPSNPVRHLQNIRLIKKDDLFHLFVTGEGFLYHMVRNIAGALVDVGRGKISPDDIPAILDAKDRRRLGITAPPQGLSLLKVYFHPVTEESIEKTIHEPFYPWNI